MINYTSDLVRPNNTTRSNIKPGPYFHLKPVLDESLEFRFEVNLEQRRVTNSYWELHLHTICIFQFLDYWNPLEKYFHQIKNHQLFPSRRRELWGKGSLFSLLCDWINFLENSPNPTHLVQMSILALSQIPLFSNQREFFMELIFKVEIVNWKKE